MCWLSAAGRRPFRLSRAGAGREARGACGTQDLGGSCVNFGCTPTKAAIASARVAHLARRGKEFGVAIPTVQVDFPAVLERAHRIALDIAARSAIRSSTGVDNPHLLRGQARLDGRDGCGLSGSNRRADA